MPTTLVVDHQSCKIIVFEVNQYISLTSVISVTHTLLAVHVYITLESYAVLVSSNNK